MSFHSFRSLAHVAFVSQASGYGIGHDDTYTNNPDIHS